MNDPIREMRGAEHMVLRLLIGSLWEEILLSKDDPVGALNAISKLQLDALDALAEKQGGGEVFNHAALHEMETFWKGVRRTVEGMVKHRQDGKA